VVFYHGFLYLVNRSAPVVYTFIYYCSELVKFYLALETLSMKPNDHCCPHFLLRHRCNVYFLRTPIPFLTYSWI